jgi:hypothetical protein
MATGVVPATILLLYDSAGIGGELARPWRGLLPTLGCVLVALGLYLMARTISLFHRVGKGFRRGRDSLGREQRLGAAP